MSEKVLGYKIEVELAADGKPIEMNEFVHSIFQNTIKGMLSALRIPEDSKEVTLKVKLSR
jgi:hypothetical protein